jgi:hypothetical protein
VGRSPAKKILAQNACFESKNCCESRLVNAELGCCAPAAAAAGLLLLGCSAAGVLLLVATVLLSISSMPGSVGSGVKKGTIRGAYKKTAEKRAAEKQREAAAAAVEAHERRRLEAAEQAEAAAKQRRRQLGAERVSDGLRVRGAAASSSAAAPAAAVPAMVTVPKASILGFLKPKAEP